VRRRRDSSGFETDPSHCRGKIDASARKIVAVVVAGVALAEWVDAVVDDVAAIWPAMEGRQRLRSSESFLE